MLGSWPPGGATLISGAPLTILLGFPLHGRCIRRRSRCPRLGVPWCVGQALATEPITECIRGSVGEAESNIELLDLLSTLAATNWDASFTVERINF